MCFRSLEAIFIVRVWCLWTTSCIHFLAHTDFPDLAVAMAVVCWVVFTFRVEECFRGTVRSLVTG